MTSSTMVTNEAMITINDGILTLSGIKFLIRVTTMLEEKRTNVVASPIPRPLVAEDVTARVGQSPSNNTNTGLSLINPLVKLVH
jgi:hypothetical protein